MIKNRLFLTGTLVLAVALPATALISCSKKLPFKKKPTTQTPAPETPATPPTTNTGGN